MAHAPNNITLSSHILDTTTGKPSEGMRVTLQTRQGGVWKTIFESNSNSDGRIKDFPVLSEEGSYRVIFDTESYFKKNNTNEYFYPEVIVSFLPKLGQHYHVPLLISPFGYSTYRGS
jgi:5-hydroxyisourate hydrolase